MNNDLKFYVSEIGADEERIDYLTTNLISLLRELDIEHINRFQTEKIRPEAKGDPISVGAFLLGISSASLPSLFTFLRDWAIDRKKSQLKLPKELKSNSHQKKIFGGGFNRSRQEAE